MEEEYEDGFAYAKALADQRWSMLSKSIYPDAAKKEKKTNFERL